MLRETQKVFQKCQIRPALKVDRDKSRLGSAANARSTFTDWRVRLTKKGPGVTTQHNCLGEAWVMKFATKFLPNVSAFVKPSRSEASGHPAMQGA